MGPVDIGIARSIMNKVLSSIISKYNGVYRSTPSLNAHVSVASNLHTFWQLREIMEYPFNDRHSPVLEGVCAINDQVKNNKGFGSKEGVIQLGKDLIMLYSSPTCIRCLDEDTGVQGFDEEYRS
jgi:hypothetical protein